MGIYNSTYVGIYLEVPFYKSENKVITYKHPETGNKMKTRFCPDTGREGIVNERIDIVYVEPNAWIEDRDDLVSDMFFCPAYTGGGNRIQTFILNSRGKYYLCNEDEIFNLDLSEIDTKQLISDFELEFKEYLDYYRDSYDGIKVCFGIVNYAH